MTRGSDRESHRHSSVGTKVTPTTPTHGSLYSDGTERLEQGELGRDGPPLRPLLHTPEEGLGVPTVLVGLSEGGHGVLVLETRRCVESESLGVQGGVVGKVVRLRQEETPHTLPCLGAHEAPVRTERPAPTVPTTGLGGRTCPRGYTSEDTTPVATTTFEAVV